MRVLVLNTVGDLVAGRRYLVHLVETYGYYLLSFDGVPGTYTFEEVSFEPVH